MVFSSLSIPQGFFLLVGFWAFISLIDRTLKTSERFQILYLSILAENGLTVSTGKLNWFTERYNRLFLQISNCCASLLQKWFDLGVVISLLSCVGSVYFLTTIPVNTLIRSESADEQILKPVIPGVNLPMTQMGYYLTSMFFSALLHEIGHALAATSEGVKVNGLGVFFFLLYPGAYVDIETTSLNSVSKWRQLKIFTAGVWHNIVICVVAALGLLSLPYIIAPLYTVHKDLTVIHHTDLSVVTGIKGLKPADIITNIDRCNINSTATWRNCLVEAIESNQSGSCVLQRFWEEAETPVYLDEEMECECAQFESEICFMRDDKVACLSAREVRSNPYCNEMQPCESDAYCIYPKLEEGSRLLSVGRKDDDDVIFMGHPALLHQSVILGEVVPKHPWIPFSPPYILEKLLKYFISLSGALAMLNVVPCYLLDGQYISNLFVDITLPSQSQSRRENIKFGVLTLGTLLLLINIILAFYNLLIT